LAGHVTTLRRWQAEALPLCVDSVRAGGRRVVQACTGSGKSILQAEVLRAVLERDGVWAVVTVPTAALVVQLGATLAARLGDDAVGLFYAANKQPGRRVVVCCVASFPRFVSEAMEAGRGAPDVWIADECHRGLASDVVRAAADLLAPRARLGFTATPWRTDGAIPGWDPPLLYRYGLADALGDGVVVPADVVTWHREDEGVDAALLEMLRRERPEGPGIVSAERIEDALDYAARMTAEGWPAAAVSGLTSKRDLADYLSWLKSGRLRALVHVNLLTEGVDLPWLRWIALRRPRSALGLVQEAGRVLRTYPGKARATIFDPLSLCPLQAFSTPERLAELEGQAADEAVRAMASEEAVEALRLEGIATAAGKADAFAAQLVADAFALGLDVQAQRVVGEARQLPATTKQRAELERLGARLQGPISRLPEATRKAVRELAKAPEHLPRGAAADLIGVLWAVGRRVRQDLPAFPESWHYARAWRWPADGSAPVMEAKAVRALTGT